MSKIDRISPIAIRSLPAFLAVIILTLATAAVGANAPVALTGADAGELVIYIVQADSVEEAVNAVEAVGGEVTQKLYGFHKYFLS